ncbi:MAG: hypothetical protein ABI690_19610 [Chloroflexota bacterium]
MKSHVQARSGWPVGRNGVMWEQTGIAIGDKSLQQRLRLFIPAYPLPYSFKP